VTIPAVLTTPVWDAREIVVNIADFAVASGRGTIVTSGLGSCIAIVLHDRVARVAALAHVLLPDADLARTPHQPAKFAPTAVPLLVGEMQRLNARGPYRAKIAGGARMFGTLLSSGVNMGERNIEATRKALIAAGIPLVGEDIGGEYGRSVYVDVATGDVRVHSLERGDRVL
jgi:chemotaxis protein CheD